MSHEKWRNKELGTLLSESWGFGFDLNRLTESKETIEEEAPVDRRVEICKDLQKQLRDAAHIGGNTSSYRGEDFGGSGYYASMARAHEEEQIEKKMKAANCDQFLREELYEETVEEGMCSGKRDAKNKCPGCPECKPMEEAEEKGKYDDGDGKDEKCDYVPCKGQDKKKKDDKKKMDEAKLRAYIRKLIQESLKEG